MLFRWTEDPLWPGPAAGAWSAGEVYDTAVKRGGEDNPGNMSPADVIDPGRERLDAG